MKSSILDRWLAGAELGAAGVVLVSGGREEGARRVWIGRKDPVPEGGNGKEATEQLEEFLLRKRKSYLLLPTNSLVNPKMKIELPTFMNKYKKHSCIKRFQPHLDIYFTLIEF